MCFRIPCESDRHSKSYHLILAVITWKPPPFAAMKTPDFYPHEII